MNALRRAIEIAMEAHRGQVDKHGAPYILHPLCVMAAVRSKEAQIVAALHDVVEDNEDWTVDRLAREGFDRSIVEAVAALTRDPDGDYFDYVRRLSSNPLAREVKLADLQDNLDRSRLPGDPTENDLARFRRYEKALRILNDPQASEASESTP
ncbi:MAG TPA: HD domain-containing protein [Rhodothermales bacterium]|nr:HD domain-containing protein [Rhodothermales bacterium]